MSDSPTPSLPLVRVGLLGGGVMGRFLLRRFAGSPRVRFVYVWDADEQVRGHLAAEFPALAEGLSPPEVWVEGAITHLVETAHPDAVPRALKQARRVRAIAQCASVGGLLSAEGEEELALTLAHGGSVWIPSGAIGGLDILRSLPTETLEAVILRTRKHPRSLPAGTAVGHEPVCLYRGSAREGIARFPKNINVAATLSLAGLGPDATQVELWADSTVDRNRHEIEIRSSVGTYYIRCANEPFEENPATSRLAALSMAQLLVDAGGGLRVGT